MSKMLVRRFKNVRLSFASGNGLGILASADDGQVMLPTEGYNRATVQVAPSPAATGAPSWAAASIAVRRTNDQDMVPVAMESAVTNITAIGMTNGITIDSFAYLALVLTAPETANDLFVDIAICLHEAAN